MHIRPLTKNDSAAFCVLSQGNATRFRNAGLARLPNNDGEFLRWLPASLSLALEPATHDYKVIYGIFTHESDSGVIGAERLAGFVGVETVSRFHGVGVWYGLDRKFQGTGMAKTGVLAAMADFASQVESLGLFTAKRWVIHVLKKNILSTRLAASIGFEREEVLDYTRSLSTRGGQRFDGFSLVRTGASIKAEADARIQAIAMKATMKSSSLPHSIKTESARRLRA